MFVVALSRICLPSHHKSEILSGSSDAHDDGRVILLFFNMKKRSDLGALVHAERLLLYDEERRILLLDRVAIGREMRRADA